MSFRGTEVRVGPVSFQMEGHQARLKTRLLFTDEAGKLHAYIDHNLVVSDLPEELQETVARLHEQIRAWALKTHYGIEASDVSKPVTRKGLADALSNSHDPEPDTPQG